MGTQLSNVAASKPRIVPFLVSVHQNKISKQTECVFHPSDARSRRQRSGAPRQTSAVMVDIPPTSPPSSIGSGPSTRTAVLYTLLVGGLLAGSVLVIGDTPLGFGTKAHGFGGGKAAGDPCGNKRGTSEPTPVSDNRIALVTGGAGFIGSNLVDYLLSLGFKVRVLDNLSTGFKAYVPAGDPRVEFIQGDVRDFAAVEKAVEGRARQKLARQSSRLSHAFRTLVS